jgi:hypothetical protein
VDTAKQLIAELVNPPTIPPVIIICDAACQDAENLLAQVEAISQQCLNDSNSTCQNFKRAATAYVLSAVDLAKQCAAGTDATCNTVVQLAKEMAQGAVTLAVQCEDGENPTCASAEGLAPQLVAFAKSFEQQCLAGANSTCNTLEATAMSTVAAALGVANAGEQLVVALLPAPMSIAQVEAAVIAEEQQAVALASQALQQIPDLSTVGSAVNGVVDSAGSLADVARGLTSGLVGDPGGAAGYVLSAVSGLQQTAANVYLDTKVSFPMVMDFDLSTDTSVVSTLGGVERLTDADGLVQEVASDASLEHVAASQDPSSLSSSASTPPPCYESHYGSGFVTYKPWYFAASNNVATAEYEYAPFVEHLARQVSGEGRTTQLEICQMGGGKSQNHWRLNLMGTYETVQDTTGRLISGASGTVTHSTTNPESKALGFQLDLGKSAQISGSLGVSAVKKEVGGWGAEDSQPPFNDYAMNAVYQEWQGYDSPRNTRQGSDSYEGNISHALWEFPENTNLGKVRVELFPYFGANCPWYWSCG